MLAPPAPFGADHAGLPQDRQMLGKGLPGQARFRMFRPMERTALAMRLKLPNASLFRAIIAVARPVGRRAGRNAARDATTRKRG